MVLVPELEDQVQMVLAEMEQLAVAVAAVPLMEDMAELVVPAKNGIPLTDRAAVVVAVQILAELMEVADFMAEVQEPQGMMLCLPMQLRASS